jgi:hypothetical protein
MIVDPSNGERDKKANAVRFVTVERFRRGLDTYLSGQDAYVILNASAVFRRFWTRRNEIVDRRPGRRLVAHDGLTLAVGWVPGERNR